MLIAWAYNELGENVIPQDLAFDARFARPIGASSALEFKVNDEHMRCSTWGAKAALTDITLSAVTRGYMGTAAANHKTGDAVWIKNEVAQVDTTELMTVPSSLSDAVTVGDINAIIPDGEGGYYIGGDFTTVGGTAGHTGLARVDRHGVEDTTFSCVVADAGTPVVWVLYRLTNGNIVVGGTFDTLGGTACESLGIIDKDGIFVAAIGGFAASAGVFSLESNDTYLFAGGALLYADNSDITKFSLIKLVNDPANAVETYRVSVNGIVNDMVVDGGTLYFGGTFTSILTVNTPSGISTTRNRLCAVKANVDIDINNLNFDMARALLPWNPNANNTVNAVLKNGNYIYAGGVFTTIGGVATTRIARVDTDGILDTVWAPDAHDASVNDIQVLTNTADGVDYLVVVGGFTTPQLGAELLNVDTDADSWAPIPDDTVRVALVDNGTIILCGDFANVGGVGTDSLAILNDNPVASEIGDYKLEWLDESLIKDPVSSVRFQVYDGGGVSATSVLDELVVASSSDRNGKHFETQKFTLERVGTDGIYLVKATVNKESGSTTHYYTLESGTVESVVLVADGTEVGDPYTAVDTFAAPGIAKVSTTYTITPATGAVSPTATESTHYFRMWLLVEPGSNIIDDYQVTFDGATVTVDITDTRYYEERIAPTTAVTTTITITVRDGATATITSLGATAVTSSGTSSAVDADQIQVEYEHTNGAWRRRVISDWQDIPGGGDFDYINIGPSADTFRFRYRYRTFRRDGIDLETGRPLVTGAWSAWTALT